MPRKPRKTRTNAAPAALSASEIHKRARSSVVSVQAYNEHGEPEGYGSGFFAGDGKVIVTNHHVIEGADTIHVQTLSGNVLEVSESDTDQENDLVLLEHPQGGKPLTLSDQSHEPGEEVVVIGNPRRWERSITKGIISAIRPDAYQIDAAISKGSSGSPVLGMNGKVLGVVVGSHSEEGQNLNFAIQIENVKNLLNIPAQRAADIQKDRTAAEQGDAEAQDSLGWAYRLGYGVPEDFAEAAKWFRRAAEQGYADAQLSLGVAYECGEGVPKDSAEAVRWYRRAAEQGLDAAQYCLGTSYLFGDGVPEDREKSEKWLLRAAEQGNEDAQFQLGEMYSDNEGIWQNNAEAAKWFDAAAKQGNVYAQLELAHMYDDGRGVPQSDSEAARWFRRAAEKGNAEAQHLLGICYYRGEGVPENDAEAIKWFLQAAEQGYIRAQYQLGMMHGEGIGVPQNYSEAYIWLFLATRFGFEEAERIRDEIAQKLSSTDLIAAQKEAEKRYNEIQSKIS